jgi:general secretion pathway protein A
MYEAHFGLQKKPFAMTPDPSFLFQTPSHREALAALLYGVLEEKGFIVITGDAGTGKTTLLSRMLRMIPSSKVAFSLVPNPRLSADEFIESALIDFGIEDIPWSKVRRLLKLQEFLMAVRQAGRVCVLVVDEAHQLSGEVLEEIRLLTNFENADRKLLQIILAGQTELRNILNVAGLRQVKQRIAVRCELRPLCGAEIAQYMSFRWAKAGANIELPFDESAIKTIACVSRGIPRVVNALCDNALTLIYATGDSCVTAAHAMHVASDMDLADFPGYHDRTNAFTGSRLRQENGGHSGDMGIAQHLVNTEGSPFEGQDPLQIAQYLKALENSGQTQPAGVAGAGPSFIPRPQPNPVVPVQTVTEPIQQTLLTNGIPVPPQAVQQTLTPAQKKEHANGSPRSNSLPPEGSALKKKRDYPHSPKVMFL